MVKLIFNIFAAAIFLIPKGSYSLPQFAMTLNETVKLAVDNSHSVKAKTSLSESQKERAKSVKSKLYPSLDVEASFSYLTNVGEIEPIPGNVIRLGDNYTYSVGPVLNWTVLDFGRISKSYKSLKALENASKNDFDAEKRNTILKARVTYFKLELSAEQLKLVSDSLKLSQSRYEDILNKYKAGGASKLDLLSAHQEVVDFKKSFKKAQSELAGTVRELYALIGFSQEADISFPIDERVSDVLNLLDGEPSITLKLDSIDNTLSNFNSLKMNPVVISEHPLVKSADFRKKSYLLLADSAKGGHYPLLNFQAKTSLDYPNTPKLEHYNQNRFSFFLTIPVFEWGKVTDEIKIQNFLSNAAFEQRLQIEIDLTSEWKQIEDKIINLKSRQKLNENSVAETSELSKLINKSYIDGRSNHLEVERANLRELGAKVESARTNVELLVEMAKLLSLSNEEI